METLPPMPQKGRQLTLKALGPRASPMAGWKKIFFETDALPGIFSCNWGDYLTRESHPQAVPYPARDPYRLIERNSIVACNCQA